MSPVPPHEGEQNAVQGASASKLLSKLFQNWAVFLQAFPKKAFVIMHLIEPHSARNLNSADSEDSEPAGAPELDVEITSAMIEAGKEELMSRLSDLTEALSEKAYEVVSKDLYRVMEETRRRHLIKGF